MNDEKRTKEENFNEISLNSADGGKSGIDLNSFSTRKTESQNKNEHRSGRFGFKNKKLKITKAGIIKIILSLFLVGMITFCLIAGAVVVYAFGFVDSTMVENLDELSLGFTTTIYVQDTSGNWVENQRLHGMYNRIWVPLEDMPQDLIDAFVAIEDRRFYDHDGVDWKRTVSAFANLFLHFYSSNQGGSTITQQLVKNLTGDDSTSPMRKVREIMRARTLEMNYYKDTIIECYLNTISMANGMYGVEVASNYYFGKSTKDLTLEECAALASIAKAPETYRPDKNPENNKKRRGTVLYEMLAQGKITQEEYDAANGKELKIVADAERLKENKINSYFIDTLIDDVVADLCEKYNYDETYAANNFYNGGYKIYSTMDPKIQEGIDGTFSNDAYITTSKKGQISQSAITVMDYKGHIKGIAGGLGEKKGNRVLNRATQSPNQAGSTMKPLSAYALAVENNMITYSSNVVDKKLTYGSWSPKNSYGYYKGTVKAYYALEKSINTVPIQLVEQMTPTTCYNFLKEKLGLSYLNDNDLNLPSLAIGGNSKGLTTTQSAAAYAIFGNGGKYYEPTTYIKVEDQRGKVILTGESEPVVAIAEDTATIVNRMLQRVIYGGEGTGAGMQSYVGGSTLYGKTGTSDSSVDKWFVGGTPYYVASCWYGFDQDEKVSATSMVKKLWGNVMKKAHSGKGAATFTDSEYVTRRYFCTETGLVATDACPKKSEGWYKKSYMPICTTHPGNSLGSIEEITSQQSAQDTPANDGGTGTTDANTQATSSTPAQ